MKIDRPSGTARNRCAGQGAFTLIEVVFSVAIAALVMAGLFQGYNLSGRRAQYSACSLAANATAMGLMEQVVSTPWVPSPPYLNNAFLTVWSNVTVTANLCLPSALGNVATCTNIVTVSNVSVNPPYAMVQVQCIWSLPSYGGTYTNTIAVLRAPTL